jgi:hypothetical protein
MKLDRQVVHCAIGCVSSDPCYCEQNIDVLHGQNVSVFLLRPIWLADSFGNKR